MARYMTEDGGYRAVVEVIVLKKAVDNSIQHATAFDYIGPFSEARYAKGAVTTARRERGTQFVDGWIEKATWTRVE